MSAKPTKPTKKEIETTGHVWDGIEELNTPMPRWWLWTFIACIIWGIGYTVAYPAWPMLTRATPGLLGSSTRADLAADMARFEQANADISAKLVSVDLTAIAPNPDLQAYAVSAGAAIFRTNCSQCHGGGAAGVQASGYPNLLDDDWLWGGDITAIHSTITHGVRNDIDPDARFSQMPAFGDILEQPQIDQVVQHVLAISGQDHDAAQAGPGAAVFAENCASCHGDAGIGNREFGAPNLTDAIWLYGNTQEKLQQTVIYARNGVMPNWSNKLTEAEIRAVAAYVHQLGGGE
jgi:cytochrome c oxidase cbb3-type subunit III